MLYAKRPLPRLLWISMAVLALLGPWLLIPPAAGAASPSPPAIHFRHNGAIRAAGAAAVVSVYVTCSGPSSVALEVTVEQKLPDGTVAAASGYAYYGACTGQPKLVRAPLEVGNCTEHSFCGGPHPIHAGIAVARAYDYGTEHLYPGRKVRLSYTDSLDRPKTATTILANRGYLVAGGAAVDLYLRVPCRHGQPVPISGVLYQRTSTTNVQYAQPAITPTGTCHEGHALLRVRVYPQAELGYPYARALHTGPAFADFTDVWGQVTLQ